MTKYTLKQTETRNWSGCGKEPGREHRRATQRRTAEVHEVLRICFSHVVSRALPPERIIARPSLVAVCNNKH